MPVLDVLLESSRSGALTALPLVVLATLLALVTVATALALPALLAAMGVLWLFRSPARPIQTV